MAGLRFDKDLINQLFREKDMQETVIYQDILQKGLKQGVRTYILSVLQSRFGTVPENLDEQLVLLTPEQMQGLFRQAATCGTLEEFIHRLADVLDNSV